MRTELIHFERGAPAREAAPASRPGLMDDGSVVCAIDNCPDDVPTQAIVARVSGLFPGEGVIRVDFADLPKPRTGSCCGSCGG